MLISFIALALFSPLVSAASDLAPDPKLGRIVAQCKPPASATAKHVWIFKQWHLAPSVNTKAPPSQAQPIPQEKNQTAIYRQLDQWIEKDQIREIYAEGCSGELTEASDFSFNGWTFDDLKQKAAETSYAEIVTHIPLKLEAKFGSKLRTRCGDDLALLKSNDLAFSDARGTLGFLTRISQYKNDPVRVKTYLEGAIELYRLPKSATPEKAIARLKSALKSAIGRIKESVEKRNATLIKAIRSSDETKVAVVFGGIHANGIVKQLEAAGIGCSVVSPVGYEDDESKLLEQLETSIRELK